MDANIASPQIENAIQEAYSLAVNGQLDDAEAAYTRLLEHAPEEPRILGTLGAIALRKGKLVEAEQFLKKAVHIDPQQAKFWLNLSAALFNLGEFAGALDAIDRALVLGNPAPETWNNQGIILNALDRPDDALVALDKSLELNPHYVDALYNKGTVLQRLGQADQAAECYSTVIELSPNHSNALYNLSILQANRHDRSQALDNLAKAISARPNFFEALINRGGLLLDLGRLDEALADTAKAVELAPGHVDALFQKGSILLRRGDAEEALACFAGVRQNAPGHARNLIALGVAHFDLKDFHSSVEAFDQAIAIDPHSAEAYNNKGLALQELKQYPAAIENYQRALELEPSYPDALYNYANALRETDALDEALAFYDQLLAVEPEYFAGWKNKGATLEKLKRRDEALEAFEQAIYLDPADAVAYFNASTALIKLGKLERALHYANKANKLDPDYVDALYVRALILLQLGLTDHAKADAERAVGLEPRHALANNILGSIRVELKRPVEALANFEIALAENDGIEYLLGKTAHLRMQLSDWRQHQETPDRILALLDQGKEVCQPFELHSLIDSPEYHRKSAQIFFEWTVKTDEEIVFPSHGQNQRIHIAYFSSDIGSHPVANLMAGVFEMHDRHNYEISLFSLDNQSGATRDRIFKSCERFINAEFLTDEEIVALAHSLKVDIAVDLNGFTSKHRTGVFARRVAPIQINYIGFLGTMGSDCHDYIIGDPVMAPFDHQGHFSEKIIHLPCYQANDDKLEIPPTLHSRDDYDLPRDAFVFCSFNANYKITPQIFAAWMRILHQVPGSVLWLHCKSETAIENLRQAAVAQGIAGDRLIFARTLPYLEHLARQRLADLFLDTHPYNAGATASNALYCGLPLVTLLGKSFCSRYGGSLLTAVDLPELITHSIEDYVALCIRIASDRNYHASLKEKLAHNLKTQPLFDTRAFTANLEKAYRAVHTRHLQGLPPEHIGVADLPSA